MRMETMIGQVVSHYRILEKLSGDGNAPKAANRGLLKKGGRSYFGLDVWKQMELDCEIAI